VLPYHDHGWHIVTGFTVPAIADAGKVKRYTHGEVTNKRGLLKRQQCHTFTLILGMSFAAILKSTERAKLGRFYAETELLAAW
jgi:hypothetical protein